MRQSSRILVVALLFISSLRVRAQSASSQPTADELQRAAAYFNASDWQHAFDAYSDLAKKYPTNSLSVFRVGVALVELGRPAEGETRLREGERLGVPMPNAAFRLAESLAEQHKGDVAIAELMRGAATFTGITPGFLEADTHFASLKANPKWKVAMDAYDALLHPCMHDARFREFDFWVGDWDVHPVGARPAGSRNNVTLEDDGCIVMEHWTTTVGSIGQSFNLFDRSVGKWRQTWVDNSGGQHDYRGGLVDGNMVLVGDTPAPNGALGRIPTRLTLFHISKDSVRQFSETSTDGGKTWTTSYNLLYVRRK